VINKGLEQLCRKVDYEKDWLKHVRTNWIEYEYNVVINADWDGLMCIDWIEIFVRIFLISPHLKIRVCWKDVLPRPVNNIFIFPKNFYLAFAQTYLTQIPLGPQAVSEWCCIAHFTLFTLSTSGTSVLFTKSVKSINITAHILQYVTLMNQNTSQHFPRFHFNTTFTHATATHKRSGLNWRLPMCWCTDTFLYIFRITNLIFLCLKEERESVWHLTLYYHAKGLICAY